jgi:hypothetical protein
VRAEAAVRVEADRHADHVHAGQLVAVLLQLGNDVARHVFPDEDGRPPAGRLVVVVRARSADARLEAAALLGVERRTSASFGHESDRAREEVRCGSGRAGARHDASGDDFDVVRGRLDASTRPFASRITPRVVGATTRRMMFSWATVAYVAASTT